MCTLPAKKYEYTCSEYTLMGFITLNTNTIHNFSILIFLIAKNEFCETDKKNQLQVTDLPVSITAGLQLLHIESQWGYSPFTNFTSEMPALVSMWAM